MFVSNDAKTHHQHKPVYSLYSKDADVFKVIYVYFPNSSLKTLTCSKIFMIGTPVHFGYEILSLTSSYDYLFRYDV